VIPVIVLGFNFFERTPGYKKLIGISYVEKALKTKLLTQYGDRGRRILSRELDPDEFKQVWSVIRENSSAKFPGTEPHIISRVAIEGGSYVTIVPDKKVVLIPDSTPIYVFFCHYIEGCPFDKTILAGTIGDLRQWIQDKAKAVRLKVDVFVSLISVILGLFIKLKTSDKSQS
jgi:hypothetical protein